MDTVLYSIKPVIERSKSVRINRQAILHFSKTVTSKDFVRSEYNNETILHDVSEEEHIAYSIIYNSLNFCYWGEPKWTVKIDGKDYDGSFGLLRALNKAIASGFDLLNPDYLEKLTESELAKILAGNVEIPLFKERLRLLNELGRNVNLKFSGSFTNIVKKGNGNASKIVEVLATDLPEIFNDVADYHCHKIKFYKRAQLVPAHLFDLKKLNLLSIDLTGYDELTAFADYKVPQLLRKFGILEYSKELSEKIDDKVKIPSGSDEEIEIRASTIWAIELTTQELKKRFPEANAAKVDGIFWFKGQVKSPDDKPYHRTLTIWY